MTVKTHSNTKYLSIKERNFFRKVAAEDKGLAGKRATALLAIGEGMPPAEAAKRGKLTMGQMRYLLARFKQKRLVMFSAPSPVKKSTPTVRKSAPAVKKPTPKKKPEPEVKTEKEEKPAKPKKKKKKADKKKKKGKKFKSKNKGKKKSKKGKKGKGGGKKKSKKKK